jgi:predicted nucleic acid-binding protein
VPVLWVYEVISVLAKAQRTDSLTATQAYEFLKDLRSLEIVVDEQDPDDVFFMVHHIAVEQKLSGYDAASGAGVSQAIAARLA